MPTSLCCTRDPAHSHLGSVSLPCPACPPPHTQLSPSDAPLEQAASLPLLPRQHIDGQQSWGLMHGLAPSPRLSAGPEKSCICGEMRE